MQENILVKERMAGPSVNDRFRGATDKRPVLFCEAGALGLVI